MNYLYFHISALIVSIYIYLDISKEIFIIDKLVSAITYYDKYFLSGLTLTSDYCR